MATSSLILLGAFGILAACVVLAVLTRIICGKSAHDCYMDFMFDILLQTLILGDSIIASILITDDNFVLTNNLSIKSRAKIVILVSIVNVVIILFKFIWPSIPTPARRRKQKEKEQMIREAEMKVMQSGLRDKRVGMRDVSTKRAREIRQAQDEKAKKEEHDRVGKRLASISSEPDPNDIDSHMRYTNNSNNTSGNTSDNYNDELPPEWKTYFNDNGIPYYYNQNTGQTTWIHPNANQVCDK